MPLHQLDFGGLHLDAWTLFGRLPVALFFLGLMLAGLRRGWGWRAALLTTAALGAGLSLGTALLPSVLGAIGGGLALWLLAQRALGLRRPPLAAVALGLTLVVALGRLGCLCAGCCFGTVSALPWAAHYGPASAPWLLHRALGLVGDAAPTSLGVHPYPLYESLALLLWLPVLLWLTRRLRSEGAVLALTAAYDLSVRAGLDGTRAMLNVWWAKLGSFAGLDRLQWALLLGALGTLALGYALERRARGEVDAPRSDDAPEPAPSVLATWGVFGGAWLLGVLCDDAQTPFLYRVHLLTLLAAVPAVRLPELRLPTGSKARALRWFALPRLAQRLAAPSLALVLAALLAQHVETTLARADGPHGAENTLDGRGWIYEVDHARKLLVRLGNVRDSGAALRVRHLALQLGPIPEAPAGSAPFLDPEPLPDAPLGGPPRSTEHWLGLGGGGGRTSYMVGDGCSGTYTTYDRTAFSGWLSYDARLPAGEGWTGSLGGRAGGGYAAATVHTAGSTTPTTTQEDDRFGFANAWAELENPNFGVGVAVYGGLVSADTSGGGLAPTVEERLQVRLGGHLRAGFPFLGLEVGYLDRDAVLGVNTLRVGLGGMLTGSGGTVEHLEDVRIRYAAGMLSYPSSREWLSDRIGFYVSGEYLPLPQLALGLQGAYFEGGGMLGASLRFRVGE